MPQHFSYLSISIPCCLTFLIALPYLASTASLIQPTKTRNLTVEASPNPICVRDSDWLGTRYGHGDCQGAVNQFISSEVQVRRGHEYEFLAPHARPIHDLPIMQTPRRYTSGSKAPPSLISPLPLLDRATSTEIDYVIRCLLPRDRHVLLPLLPSRQTTRSPTGPLLLCRRQQLRRAR